MISIYSLPATAALALKSLIFYFSRKAKIQNQKTLLFSLAVLFSIAMNIVEVWGLNYGLGLHQDIFGFAYYAALIPLNVIIAHLAILIAFNNVSIFIVLFLYGFVLYLELLLLFSDQLIVGFEVLRGYTITRIPGSKYGIYEIFMFCCMLTMVISPFFGLRADRPALMRSQCKLWIVAAAPFTLLLFVILTLLHFKIHLFNATVTMPLVSTFLLATVGYAVHNNRIIEIDFYIPWSRTRKVKAAFYSTIVQFAHELVELKSAQEVINRLAAVLNCPVVLISIAKPEILGGGAYEGMPGFPQNELRKIDRMVTVDDVRATAPDISSLMQRYAIAAIAPFYPQSNHIASWLLLGKAFSEQVYTPLDFKVVEKLFDKLGALLLDGLIAQGTHVPKDRAARGQSLMEQQEQIQEQFNGELKKLLEKFGQDLSKPLEKPLDVHLAEIEALFLKEILKRCGGNRARAARFLGLRPNTLHYKMERYGLLTKKSKDD